MTDTQTKAEQFAEENNLSIEINQAYIDNVGEEYATAEDVEEAYQGEYIDDMDFARSLVEELGGVSQVPSYIVIDWERTANDFMMDYFAQDGYYFSNL